MLNRWSKEELDLLYKYYPDGGYFLCKEKGLKRKRDATLKKAQSLNLKVSNKNYNKGAIKPRWSDWELDILKEHYFEKGKNGMVALLPNRTYSAIYLKATELGLITECESDVNKWSDEELKILHNYYPKLGVLGCINNGLNRTECAIIKKANALGIKMSDEDRVCLFNDRVKSARGNYVLWSDFELEILETYFEDYGAKECQKRGIQRDIASIYRKAKSKGLKIKRGADV